MPTRQPFNYLPLGVNMYSKHTVSIADTTGTDYTVSADELHIFIADTVKRCGGIHCQSDILLDYESMLHRMVESAGYMWSIRATGTWFMPVTAYAINQPDMFTTPIIRYVVVKTGDTYEFTEYIKLDLTNL